jgi:1-acyl-sn-glycerol-3-phosphate acyltransferase
MKAAGVHRPDPVPVISPVLSRWFAWYGRRYLRRNFHALRILRAGSPPAETSTPTVFFFNHASWWDPMIALHLAAKFYPNHQAFGPIDAAAVERYPFMKRLGFFPVEGGTARGARQFFRSASAILSRPNHSLWLTPQGRFADVRERPMKFETGLGHLAARGSGARFVPIAIEYTWWFERSPEVLIAFGSPVLLSPQASPDECGTLCENALMATQDLLAEASCRRAADAFEVLLSGTSGVGGVYDLWRRFRARLRGEAFTPQHHLPDPP